MECANKNNTEIKKYLVALSSWEPWIGGEFSKCGDANVAIDLAKELSIRGRLLNIKDENNKIVIPITLSKSTINQDYALQYYDEAKANFEKLYSGFTIRFLMTNTIEFRYAENNQSLINLDDVFEIIEDTDENVRKILLHVALDSRGSSIDQFLEEFARVIYKFKKDLKFKLNLVNIYRDISRWYDELAQNRPLEMFRLLNEFDLMLVHDSYQYRIINKLFGQYKLRAAFLGELSFYNDSLSKLINNDENIESSSNKETYIYYGRPKSILKDFIFEEPSILESSTKENKRFIFICNFNNDPEVLNLLLYKYGAAKINLNSIKSLAAVDQFLNQNNDILIFNGYYDWSKSTHRRIIEASGAKYYIKPGKTNQQVIFTNSIIDRNMLQKDKKELSTFEWSYGSLIDEMEYADIEAAQFGLKIVVKFNDQLAPYVSPDLETIKRNYSAKLYVDKLINL